MSNKNKQPMASRRAHGRNLLFLKGIQRWDMYGLIIPFPNTLLKLKCFVIKLFAKPFQNDTLNLEGNLLKKLRKLLRALINA